MVRMQTNKVVKNNTPSTSRARGIVVLVRLLAHSFENTLAVVLDTLFVLAQVLQ